MNRANYTAAELAEALAGRLDGEDPTVSGLSAPEAPRGGTAVVLGDEAQAKRLETSDVAVLVVPEGFARKEFGHQGGKPRIYVRDPRLALARLSRLFDARPQQVDGVHAAATVHPTAVLAADVRLAAGVVVEAGAVVGAGCQLGPGCVVGPGAQLGEGCRLHANVTLYDGVRLGRRVILHSGVVIGSDGFGYAPGPKGAEKVHHLGHVEIGDDVEIGANSCVDRGTLEPTRIGARTKIDNLCQVGHNVQIGSDCLIAGMAAIGGSTTLGDGVTVGGNVAFADHLRIGPGARVAGRAGVTKDVPAGETWGGFPAAPYRQWVRNLYLQGKLERIWAFVRAAGPMSAVAKSPGTKAAGSEPAGGASNAEGSTRD